MKVTESLRTRCRADHGGNDRSWCRVRSSLRRPGSGKTEVVAALLEHFGDEGLDSFGEVMAISFSRAAVSALERRVGRGTTRPRLMIRTLDSLASRLLDDLDEEDWRALSFDGRIERALELVDAESHLSDLVDLKHVIVDEVQDLVGDRARLVLAVLTQLPQEAGFTLLGDPHQAVYDFQLTDDNDMTSARFLDAVRRLGVVDEVRLRGQYRARSGETTAAASVLNDVDMGGTRTRTLRSFVAGIFMAGEVTELAGPVQRWSGTTAFLCRTNGQAMVVAEKLAGSWNTSDHARTGGLTPVGAVDCRDLCAGVRHGADQGRGAATARTHGPDAGDCRMEVAEGRRARLPLLRAAEPAATRGRPHARAGLGGSLGSCRHERDRVDDSSGEGPRVRPRGARQPLRSAPGRRHRRGRLGRLCRGHSRTGSAHGSASRDAGLPQGRQAQRPLVRRRIQEPG